MTRPAKRAAEAMRPARRRAARRRPALHAVAAVRRRAPSRRCSRAHRVARWIRAALDAPAEITVRVVDEDEGLALNRAWRQKDAGDQRADVPVRRASRRVQADLVLCAPVVEREAGEQGVDARGALRAPARPRDAARAGPRPRAATPTPRRMERARRRSWPGSASRIRYRRGRGTAAERSFRTTSSRIDKRGGDARQRFAEARCAPRSRGVRPGGGEPARASPRASRRWCRRSTGPARSPSRRRCGARAVAAAFELAGATPGPTSRTTSVHGATTSISTRASPP